MNYYGYKPNKKEDRAKALDELRLYTLREIEPVVGVTYRTLIGYVTSGRLKATKVGGRWTVSQENLRKFVNGE